jgi:peptide deformylase
MAVKDIVKKGHPALSAKSSPVKNIDAEIQNIIQDLKDTLYNTTGIGLAAPQIAINRRIILNDLRNGMEPIILINPEIIKKQGKQESEEGCLSYPGYYGFLERPEKVVVKGISEKGFEIEYNASELLCRAFCHEIDHLNGIMFTDKAYELYKEEEE